CPLNSGVRPLRRVAIYCWSISAGTIGFFIGLAFLGSYHTFENWQVGLGGFITALVLAIPVAMAVSFSARKLSTFWLRLLGTIGALLLLTTQVMFWQTVVH
ncbi:hypothetical protein, partial [Arenimonas oryziterrae]|uniref:hypothetical protein n=1 Tax=Arenimonas oryziterrae TaxID=498055 RepID=UPI001B8084DE